MFDALSDDVKDMIIGQGVVDRLTLAAVLYQLGVLEDPELMRDGRLVHV